MQQDCCLNKIFRQLMKYAEKCTEGGEIGQHSEATAYMGKQCEPDSHRNLD